MARSFPSKIISDGQTRVARADLHIAVELGLSFGGWCPKGRMAEDGPIDLRYPLRGTNIGQYRVRTEAKVKEADVKLILTTGKAHG